MKHVAIMKKSWGLTDKILSGQKKIESRWYSVKCKPWDSIRKGDVVYFKNSGEPIMIRADVSDVRQFINLTPVRVRELLNEYGEDDGIEQEKIPEFFEKFKDKKYCLLIFLKNPQRVRPFEIDKTGFGAMAAWISVNDISKITKSCG